MRKNSIHELMITSLFIAIGLILPQVFHMFSMGGPMFLPMHIPIIIGSSILSPGASVLLGILTPMASSLLTGMPVAYPMLPIMMIELATYAFVTSYLTNKYEINIYLKLAIAMIAGRISAGLIVAILFFGVGFQINPINFIIGAIITGLPGIIIQFIVVPPLQIGLKNITKRYVLA